MVYNDRSGFNIAGLLRPAEMEAIQRDFISRYLGFDIFSRNTNTRQNSILYSGALGGIGSRADAKWEDVIRSEDIRRINVTAQIANSNITQNMVYAEIHPKLTPDSKYPRDFDTPKRVEEFLEMDTSKLNRIMDAYNLSPNSALDPLYSRTSLSLNSMLTRSTFRGPLSSSGDRSVKLRCLLEFLGVNVGDGDWDGESERDREERVAFRTDPRLDASMKLAAGLGGMSWASLGVSP